MNRTAALLSALLVTAACGGRVVVDGVAEGAGGSPSSSTTGSSSSTGGGGCDAAGHTLHAGDYNASCMQASDCAPVFIGSFCDGCWCGNAAINASDLMKYLADKQIKAAGVPPPACFCPAFVVSCVNGQCAGGLP